MEGVGGGLLDLAVGVMRAEETLHTFTGDSQTAGQGDGGDGVLRDQGREAACKGRKTHPEGHMDSQAFSTALLRPLP